MSSSKAAAHAVPPRGVEARNRTGQGGVGVERGAARDASALAAVFMAAFPPIDDAQARIFPPGIGHAFQEQAWARFLAEAGGEGGCDVAVIRGHDGAVLSAALVWVIGPAPAGLRPWRRRWPATTPGMADAEWVSFQEGMAAQHAAVMGSEPHVYAEIIMTHPSARGRGHASALVRAACAAADDRCFPVYLDSTPGAMGLYSRHGFVSRPDLAVADAATCPMVRPSRTRAQI